MPYTNENKMLAVKAKTSIMTRPMENHKGYCTTV